MSNTVTELSLDKPHIDFTMIEDNTLRNEQYYDVGFNRQAVPFLKEVWPNLTMRDLIRLNSLRVMQIAWSARGYGVRVTFNGDSRW